MIAIEVAASLLTVTSALCAQQGAVSGAGGWSAQDDARFEAVADPVWAIPAAGDTTPIAIALRITNNGGGPLVFNTLDTIGISLTDPEGRVLPMDGGRDGTRPGKPLSDPLAPGEELLIDRSASLVWTAEETLRLEGDDGFGGLWYVDGLAAGVHLLHVTYESRSTRGESDTRIWTGKAAIPPVEVKLE